MKILFKNILFFSAFFISLTVLVNVIPVPEVEGNLDSKIKLEYLKNKSNSFNTLFIGSSRTMRHINPTIFDSIMHLNKVEINSFNLGTPATFYPESFYILDKIPSNLDVKYIFFELQSVKPITRGNLFAAKSYYYLNPEYLSFVIDYSFATNGSFLKNVLFVNRFFISYAFKLIAGKYMAHLPDQNVKRNRLGEKSNGFISLESERETNKARKKFLQDTSSLIPRIKASKLENSTNKKNDFLADYLSSIFLEYQRKGIELYFVLHPRLTDYGTFKDLMMNEELKSRILVLSNAKEFPQFYQSRFSFDVGHLNEKGANLFTEKMAEMFLKKIDTTKLYK